MLITRLESELVSETALGLTEDEFHTLEQEAFLLLIQDRAICVARQLDDVLGVCIKIFGENSRSHTVARSDRTYYILDPDRNVLAESRSFDRMLKLVQSL